MIVLHQVLRVQILIRLRIWINIDFFKAIRCTWTPTVTCGIPIMKTSMSGFESDMCPNYFHWRKPLIKIFIGSLPLSGPRSIAVAWPFIRVVKLGTYNETFFGEWTSDVLNDVKKRNLGTVRFFGGSESASQCPRSWAVGLIFSSAKRDFFKILDKCLQRLKGLRIKRPRTDIPTRLRPRTDIPTRFSECIKDREDIPKRFSSVYKGQGCSSS